MAAFDPKRTFEKLKLVATDRTNQPLSSEKYCKFLKLIYGTVQRGRTVNKSGAPLVCKEPTLCAIS